MHAFVSHMARLYSLIDSFIHQKNVNVPTSHSLIQHDAGYVTIAENAPGLSAEEEVRREQNKYNIS